MNFDDIFSAYYTQYRGEATIPSSTDDEYTIGLRLANEALNHWANYDGTYWRELFTTLQLDGGGDQTLATSDTTYLAPGNFKEAGGSIKVLDSNNKTVDRYEIIDIEESQFRVDDSTYAYFARNQDFYSTGTISQSGTTVTGVGTTWTSAMVGMQILYASGEVATITAFTSTTEMTVSPSQTVASTTYRIIAQGYTLNLNPSPTATHNGKDIDYPYYKKVSEYTTGTSISEIPNPYFVVHHMLANRFRVSRNTVGYQTAKRDSENALKVMQADNNSGTWANPWQLKDHSGSTWGGSIGGNWGV
ncbi:MAG: hypothetical protein ACXABY_31125 [Candidatus Thorarchaeota archaeon]|jgi:hypothetical protein